MKEPHAKIAPIIRWHPCDKCGGGGKLPDVDSLVEAREKLYVSQASMAVSMGITRGALCDIERGRRPMPYVRGCDYIELLNLVCQQTTPQLVPR